MRRNLTYVVQYLRYFSVKTLEGYGEKIANMLITSRMQKFISDGTGHALVGIMATPARVTEYLKRLCALERGKGTLAACLSELEKRHEIQRLRSIIPAFILGHHDRKIQMGKPSIVPVISGICSACHLSLPSGHAGRLQSSQDLEVCDNCGTFIYLEAGAKPAAPEAAATGRRKRKSAGAR